MRDEDGDEGVIVAKPEKGSRTVEYNIEYLLPGFRMEWRKSELTPIQEEPIADVAEEPWQPKVGDRVNWTLVHGEFDNSTIVEYEGAFYDHKLRATNGKYTYAYIHELEPVAAPVESEEPTTTPAANNDNLVLTITAPNERTAAVIRSYAALIECDVAS